MKDVGVESGTTILEVGARRSAGRIPAREGDLAAKAQSEPCLWSCSTAELVRWE